ncbi:MAG: RsmB/NOP family class I SAM-dependent RNA methyltransferase [Sulfolobaceae archaeon]|nr:RsmB/NOP family class I SAM-dependent RNA methyltransferase [Sulfolobaceae archaeon]
MIELLSRVLFYVEKGDPLPIAFKKAKEMRGYKGVNYEEAYELARLLVLHYFSLRGKSDRKKVKEFLKGTNELKLPDWMEEELSKIYDLKALKESFKEKNVWIRVNTLKADEDKVIKSLEDKGIVLERDKDIPYVYKVLSGNVRNTEEFRDYKVVIHDKASVAVVEALRPEREDIIFDMTSAPGMKASLIFARTENKVKLVVASDFSLERLEKERRLLKAMGVDVAKIEFIRGDGRYLKVRADKVLLDAPCTSSGMISNEPTVLLRLSKERVKEMSELQRSLLENALKLSSYIVYATCSLFPEEGEEVVKDFRAHPPLNFGSISRGGNRFIPYLHHTEGFFISLVKG